MKHRLLGIGVPLLLLLVPAASAGDDDNATCLECHTDAALMEGKRVVEAKVLAGSVHASQDCINCHSELEGTKYPHKTGLEKVRCAECHDKEGEQHARSRHGQASARGDALAPTCAACHGSHEVLKPDDPKSRTYFFNIPFLCGTCHKEGSEVTLTHDIPQEKIFEHYSESLHGEGIFKKGLLRKSAICIDCHTSHEILPHDDPKSSIHTDNVAGTCMRCHALIERVHRQVIEGRLWEEEPGKIPACVDCHPPHKLIEKEMRGPRTGAANAACLECHGTDPGLSMERDGKRISLHVDQAAHEASVHFRNGVRCAQCHSDVLIVPGVRPCASIRSRVDCATCHAGPVSDYESGIHGKLHAQGDPDAPHCLDCHEKHRIQDKRTPTSPTFSLNVPQLCARCHREGEKAARRIDSDPKDIVGSYEESIHGKGLRESGLTRTAHCASCHTAHRELPPDDPASSVHGSNIAATCGDCHHGIEEKFKTSVHWPANTETDRPLPTCEDCHTSHTITRTDATGFRVRMMDQCGRCHTEQAETFFETYHGKVSRGLDAAAKCYDCHGTHEIFPVTDPRSTLSRQNVVATCGQCHTSAHRRFAGYLTHATHHDRERYPWLFWTFWIMTGLLVGTLGFAFLHTAAWLVRLWLTRDEWRAHKAALRREGQKLFRRFDRYQRMQHLLMLLAFFTLALTGMALKFSYMGWAQVVSTVLGGFGSMGVLHRLGGVTLLAVFLTHLASVWRRKRQSGKGWKEMITGPNSILLLPRDLKEVWASIRWFFGKGPRPKYGRWTYWEKFDYFAVFWGVLVIGSTGLILWFPEVFTHVVPGWFLNVATIIHSDEALLAVGFIFTIHFFNTHFRPDKWPMDPVIFTGRVTIEELKYDKPAEYERLMKAGEIDKHMVDPFPPAVERGARIFGFIALAIGLTLIALIVYTVVFGYR